MKKKYTMTVKVDYEGSNCCFIKMVKGEEHTCMKSCLLLKCGNNFKLETAKHITPISELV